MMEMKVTLKEQLYLLYFDAHCSTANSVHTFVLNTHVKTKVRNGKDSNQALDALLACQVFEEGVEGVPR